MKHLLTAFLMCAALTGFAGCGGSRGDDGEASAGSPDQIAEAKEEALAAKSEAEAVEAQKYAKNEFDTADRMLAKADERDDRRAYIRAEQKFKDAAKRAKANRNRLEAVFAIEAEYKKLREEALKGGGDKLVPENWDLAEKSFQRAKQRLEEGRNAKSGMVRARDDMKHVISQIGRMKTTQSRADEAKQLMSELRGKAEEAGAGDKAPADMEWAKDQERKAEQAYTDANYRQAEQLFNDAKTSYAFALQNAQGLKVATANQPGTVSDSAGHADHTGDRTRGSTEDTNVGDIDVPDPGDLPTDVITQLHKLFHVNPEYSNGLLQIAYEEDGENLQKDAAVFAGKVGETVLFTGEEHTGLKEYTFGGNQTGGFLVKASLEEKVKVEVEVQFQLWAAVAKKYWEVLVFWNQSTQSGYALQVGNQGILAVRYKDGNAVGGQRSKYTKDVNRWLIRRESHRFEVVVKPDDKGKGVMTVAFDGEDIIQMKASAYDSGFVGFRWKDAKFYVPRFTVTGMLDEEWAAKALTGKTGRGEEDDGTGGGLDF